MRQVEQRAAIGAQLAGRGYAAQRNISQAAGLTIPQTTQMLLNRANYPHTVDDIHQSYLNYGENEEFYTNMDPTTQVQGLEILNRYDAMTPYQKRMAMFGANASRGPLTPFNQGFANNLLLIQ